MGDDENIVESAGEGGRPAKKKEKPGAPLRRIQNMQRNPDGLTLLDPAEEFLLNTLTFSKLARKNTRPGIAALWPTVHHSKVYIFLRQGCSRCTLKRALWPAA
jgi:hypothetical protein